MNSQRPVHSALYRGWVRHRRFVPKAHAFTYPLLMWYVDLDEVVQVMAQRWYTSLERFNLIAFRRKDYFAPEQQDLKQAVIDRVAQDDPDAARGITRVAMLTHLRYLGYLFNPVTFYYCFQNDGRLCAILAEITNTPWGERHAYVLPLPADSAHGAYHRFEFDKQFHVSPFNPMAMRYHWVFSQPEQQVLRVHMDNTVAAPSGEPGKHFDATLVMKRQRLGQGMGRVLIRYPLETVKVSMGIYWQALRLWWKGVPFHDHPKHGRAPGPSSPATQEYKG